MKKLVLLFLTIVVFFRSYAQVGSHDFFAGKSQNQIIQWQKGVGDKWFNTHVGGMLRVGQKVTDFALGAMLNDHTGKEKISDFKGKLVILDFWTTYCKTCIAAWPHMSSLQKEFGDQIQIILVNKSETRDKISERLQEINQSSGGGAELVERKDVNGGFHDGIKLPDNLPVITGEREDLDIIFPTRGVPHHVWIDEKGIVRAFGDAGITNEENIKNWLAGKRVDFMTGYSSTPLYRTQSSLSYHQLMHKPIAKGKYNSIITGYNRFLAGGGNSFVKNVIDKTNHSIRNTFINCELLDLYGVALQKYMVLPQGVEGVIFGPTHNDNSTSEFVIMDVADTIRYTTGYLIANKGYSYVPDQALMKARVCYEQIAYTDTTEENLCHQMLFDLNKHFGKLYGVEVHVEKRKVPSYVLVRTSGIDKLSINGQKGEDLSYILRSHIKRSSIANLFRVGTDHLPTLFINETGFSDSKAVVMSLPTELNNIEDLRNAVKIYDLDIIKAEREFNFMVFKEKNL